MISPPGRFLNVVGDGDGAGESLSGKAEVGEAVMSHGVHSGSGAVVDVPSSTEIDEDWEGTGDGMTAADDGNSIGSSLMG